MKKIFQFDSNYILNHFDEIEIFPDEARRRDIYQYCLVTNPVQITLHNIIQNQYTNINKDWNMFMLITKDIIQSINYLHLNSIIIQIT